MTPPLNLSLTRRRLHRGQAAVSACVTVDQLTPDAVDVNVQQHWQPDLLAAHPLAVAVTYCAHLRPLVRQCCARPVAGATLACDDEFALRGVWYVPVLQSTLLHVAYFLP